MTCCLSLTGGKRSSVHVFDVLQQEVVSTASAVYWTGKGDAEEDFPLFLRVLRTSESPLTPQRLFQLSAYALRTGDNMSFVFVFCDQISVLLAQERKGTQLPFYLPTIVKALSRSLSMLEPFNIT